MTTSNFKTVHNAIRTLIENGGVFKYIELKQWINFETGFFPDALLNNSFTIKLPEMGPSEFESADWGSLKINIEFVLDTQRDLYLEKLDDCIDAIGGLTALNTTEVVVETFVDNRSFDSQDLQDHILVGFRGITLELRSA